MCRATEVDWNKFYPKEAEVKETARDVRFVTHFTSPSLCAGSVYLFSIDVTNAKLNSRFWSLIIYHSNLKTQNNKLFVRYCKNL